MLVCSLCGSDEVVYDAWVNVNDCEDVQIFDDIYCKGCEQTTHVISEEDYLDSKC